MKRAAHARRLLAALPRLVAHAIGAILLVMGVGEVLIHGGFVGPRSSFIGMPPCAGLIDTGPGCLYPRNVAWALGFGSAGIATLVAFTTRRPAWMRGATLLVALAWAPYFVLFVPEVWGRVGLVEFLVDSANVAVFCLAAAPALAWARRRMSDAAAAD